MEETFQQFYANGALLVMWGALLFHLLLPIPHAAHPVTLWHKFAEQLANKVNNNHNYSQSIISGGLALLLMLVPCLILLLAMKPLVWQAPLFELALLLIALDWRNNESLAKQLVTAMSNENKVQCRALLKPYLNRDTESLSLLGIGKAGAETIIMGYGRNVVCVLFWYGVTGGIGALMYRLTAELARAWSPSRRQYSPFGKPVIQLTAVLEIIPLRLFAMFIGAGKNVSSVSTAMLQQAKSYRFLDRHGCCARLVTSFNCHLVVQLCIKDCEPNVQNLGAYCTISHSSSANPNTDSLAYLCLDSYPKPNSRIHLSRTMMKNFALPFLLSSLLFLLPMNLFNGSSA